MSLAVSNTRALIDPANVKLKVLVYGLSGLGKSTWAATAPNPGFVACETGHGHGLASIAAQGVEFVAPNCLPEFDAVCAGQVFKDKETIVLDSLSEMVRTFIKDSALAIPRPRGESDKRRRGVPELDDYGVMGELTRRAIKKLLDVPKHIIVTATERYDKPDPENGQGELLIGPDLPGAMFLGATAMFDMVLRVRAKQALRDPKDAKSRYMQRYILTEPDGQGSIVKNRYKGALAPQEVFDLDSGAGCFPDIVRKVVAQYEKA